MDVSSLKLLFGVVLIFTTTITYTTGWTHVENCSNVSPYLSTNAIMPIRYDVNLTIKSYANIIRGIMNITIDVKILSRRINLHARGIDLVPHNIIIKSIDSQESEVNKLLHYTNCESIDTLVLLFDHFIKPGLYLLQFEFATLLNNGNTVTLRYPYLRNNVIGVWMFMNLHTHSSIRGLFPCWDQPEVKASFNISIKHPIEYTAFLNLPRMNEMFHHNVDAIMTLTTFYEIPSIPTYLLGFVMVNDVVKTSSVSSGINSVWHRPEVSKAMKLALEVAQYITLEISTKTNLRLSVIGNINHIILLNSPLKSMGRPGLIIYRERDVIFDKDLDMPGQHIDVTKLITYETTRQWFDHLVGPHRYSDLWIHKILSSFYSYYIPSKIWEEDRFMELFVVQNLPSALDSDNILNIEAIMHEFNDINEIDALLYPRLYKTGAAIIRMLFHLVTPKKFEMAISSYLTGTTDLWTNLEEVHPLKTSNGYTIKDLMNLWLTTKHFPELHVIRNFGNKTARCQAIFREMKMNHWKIPITYITQSNLISNNISNVTWYQWPNDIIITDIDPEDFILVNVEHVGYYRVVYDDKSWYKISAFLQFENFLKIPVLNRAQLISDVYYFTAKGDIHISVFLNIIKYLKWEKDFIAWHSMFNILSYMSTFFEYSESKFIKPYLLEILDGIVKNDDYIFRDYDDNAMPQALRMLAIRWACKLGHIGCKKAATAKLITNLKSLKGNNVPSRWKDWVFCTGMMLANKTIWNIILDEAERYNNIMFFKYLSCTDDEEIILHYVDYLHGEKVEEKLGRSIKEIFFSVIKKHMKKDTLLKYILKNYVLIKTSLFSEFHHRDILGIIIMNVYSEEQLNEIANFIEKNYDIILHDSAVIAIDIILDQRRLQIQQVLKTFEMF
ncbi:aminopeptidase N-like [Odontomachus brunneus]|uniref:aminopeptidase N-like n=1 Tax=Odontomachus brunneus TaxID=486640 RepID=UPI0013F1AA61|nr:aminopeptidase N-like [Odontomachus brunneus]XP_032687729.1 aminopeptidase N-like [Odontomachus brunneus]